MYIIFSGSVEPHFHSYTTPINIFPKDDSKNSRTINIRSTIQSTSYNVHYYAKFNIIDTDCINPLLTIYFGDTDFGGSDGNKFLNVSYQNQVIATCGSNNDICGDYKYCLEKYPLLIDPNDSILSGEQIVIHLEKGNNSNVPSSCSSSYSLWADVTISCNGVVLSSTQPIESLLTAITLYATSTAYPGNALPTGWSHPVEYINIGQPGLVGNYYNQLTVYSEYESMKTITGIQVTSIGQSFSIEYSLDGNTWIELPTTYTGDGTCCSNSESDIATITIHTFTTPFNATWTRMNWGSTMITSSGKINAQFIGYSASPTKEPTATPTTPPIPILDLSNWSTSQPPNVLPRQDYQQIVGYNETNDSIIIIGGRLSRNDVSTIQINPVEIMDFGPVFSVSFYSESQSYVQHGYTLYFPRPGSTNHIMGMNFLDPLTNSVTLQAPDGIPFWACFTSISMEHDYLFVIGGQILSEMRDDMTIYDITNQSWFIYRGGPQLHTVIRHHTCSTVDQRVYSIAGNDGSSRLDSIQVLDVSIGITNIMNATWKYLPETLPIALQYPRSIEYGENILVFGGTTPVWGEINQNIYVINTVTNSIYNAGTLNYPGYQESVIIVYPRIYVFGGRNVTSNTKKAYQYHTFELSC